MMLEDLTKRERMMIDAIQRADIDKERELVGGLKPYDVQDVYSDITNKVSKSAGITSKDAYNEFDIPDVFMPKNRNFDKSGSPSVGNEMYPLDTKPRLIDFEKTKVGVDEQGREMVRGGYYNPIDNTIHVPANDVTATLHEMSHAADEKSAFTGAEPSETSENMTYREGRGLGNALNYFKGHTDQSKFINRNNLWNLLNNLPAYQTDRSAEGPVNELGSPASNLFGDINRIKNYAIETEPFKSNYSSEDTARKNLLTQKLMK